MMAWNNANLVMVHHIIFFSRDDRTLTWSSTPFPGVVQWRAGDGRGGRRCLTSLAMKTTIIKRDTAYIDRWGRIDGIESLSLHNTELGGSIPKEQYTDTRSLEPLLLNNCCFTGTTSKQDGLLTMLQHLDLANNSFAGSIPMELSNVAKLQHLMVNRNAGLVGSMPVEPCTSNLFQSPGASFVADCALNRQHDIAAVECDCCTKRCTGTFELRS
jgi:hypothetical protein